MDKKMFRSIRCGAYILALVLFSNSCGLVADLPMKDDIVNESVIFTWVPVSPTPYFKANAPQGSENFGYSVDISDNFAVVGTLNNRVYVYTNSNGVLSNEQILTGTNGVLFGYSVAVSGDYIVVGDPGYSTGGVSGSADLFHYNGSTWDEVGWLNCPSTAPDAAGFSVDIDGDYIAVGDPYNSTNAGVCYIFYRNYLAPDSWGRQETLASTSAAAEFGTSVSISGSNIVIGAPKEENTGGADSGAFFFSTRSGAVWSSPPTLVKAVTPVVGAWFGISVGISGNNIVVGESQNDSVYLYRLDGGICKSIGPISTTDSTPNDEFGNSVSIAGSFIGIGAHFHDTGATNSGTAYIFNLNQRQQEKSVITKTGPLGGDQLGFSLSMSTNCSIVGIPYDDDSSSDSGKVVVYKKVRQ